MYFLIIGIILLFASLYFIVTDKNGQNLKYQIFCYIYSLFFVFLAWVTHDPLNVPFIGEISPDGVLTLVLAFSGGIFWKIYSFFNNMKTDVADIKNKLSTHIEKCVLRHEELEKRLSKKRR